MSKKKSATEVLVELGMKEALIAKLHKDAIENIALYAIDNHKQPKLLNSLIQLASMELQGKTGAAYLAGQDLATPLQLKSLSSKTIKTLADDHMYHQDAALIIKMLKQAIIMEQQEKLFTKTDGLKGEYYIDPSIVDDDEAAIKKNR